MSAMPATDDDLTPIEPGDRFLVGSDPATVLRVMDVVERNGRQMARIEGGRHEPVQWLTPVADVRDKIDRERYTRVESR